MQRWRPSAATKGGRPSAGPLCGFFCIGSEQSTCPSSQHSTCLASQKSRCLNKAHAIRLNTKRCPVFTAITKEAACSPFVVSFVLAVNTGHTLVLRRKTCALSRAKTSARKTCAVLRAWTCASFRASTKETTEGGGRRPLPYVVAAEDRHLCI